MYKIKDKLIFKGYGVVTVKRIDNKFVGDKQKQFYVLEVNSNLMTIMLPVDQTDLIRPLASKAEVNKVLDFIENGIVKVSKDNWSKRYREYYEELKEGELFQVAVVYKKLLSNGGDISFGERKMLERAKELLTSEIGLVLKLSQSVIDQLLLGGRNE